MRRSSRAAIGLLYALLPAACVGQESAGDVRAASAAAQVSAAKSTAPAAAAQALPDFSDARWTRVASRTNRFLVCWRALAERVPRNEDFTLEVWLFDDGRALSGATLSVGARMPEHNHGMLRVPRTTDRGDGSYAVEGMLLHMRGHWELVFDVLSGNDEDVAVSAIELQ